MSVEFERMIQPARDAGWMVGDDAMSAARAAAEDAEERGLSSVSAADVAAIATACRGGGRLVDLLAGAGDDEEARAPAAFRRAAAAWLAGGAAARRTEADVLHRWRATNALSTLKQWEGWIVPGRAAAVWAAAAVVVSSEGRRGVEEMERILRDREILAVPLLHADGQGWSGRSPEEGE